MFLGVRQTINLKPARLQFRAGERHPYFTMNKTNERLTVAALMLDRWREAYKLTDDEVRHIITRMGWGLVVAGEQQRLAAKVKTELRAETARENGRKGGRPKKAKVGD